jgi:hypothetical protein
MSTTIIDQDAQEAMSLVRQQGLEILGQVNSLTAVVKELEVSQQSLHAKQTTMQGQMAAQASANLKMVQSLQSLRDDFLKFRTSQEEAFAVEQAKYKESMDKLSAFFSEETGVKGPLGVMDTDDE